VPLIACILPIRVALSKNLYDTLDVRHSKTKAVKLEIERSEDKGFDVAWVIVSFGMVFFGFLVYYLLPLSLLSFNLTLFANIFFGILLGMLWGLILLSLNFEHITERLVTFLFLWWERSQIPALVLKNLVAHRVRNRKTTLMYALSIGFIIFITVSYRVEILTLQYSELKEHGAEMALEKQFSFISPAAVAPLEHLLVSGTYRDVVADFTWVTAGIGEWGYIDEAAVFSNLGNYKSAEIRIHGVSSNFFDVADDVFLIPAQSDTSTGESLSEQLYSIAGSQSVVFGSALQNSFFMAGLNAADKPSFLLQTQATDLQAESRASKMGTLGEASETLQRLYQYPLQPLAYLDSCPKFSASRFAEDDYSMVVSMPTFLSMTKGHFKSMRDVPMNSLLIKFHAEATDKQKDQLKLDLADAVAFSDVKVFDSRDLATVLETTDQVMTLIFGVATYIAMFLCLFSLVSSLYTNIFDLTY
jgi:hypothetical protein